MLRYFIQFQRFDMRERVRVNHARDRFYSGMCTCIDDHFGAAQLTNGSVVYRDFHCLWANEAPCAEDEFRSALFVIAEVRIVPTRYHPAFPIANRGHINGEICFRYPELFASADVRGNLRTVYDILTRETGNVRTRSADVFAVTRRDPLALPGKGPSTDMGTCASAEYHKIILFRDNLPRQPS